MHTNSSVSITPLVQTLLRNLRSRSAAYCRTEVSGNWGIDLPFEEGVRFHFVVRGDCWIRSGSTEPAYLKAGDFCLLPHGTHHSIASSPQAPARPVWEQGLVRVADNEYRLTLREEGECALIHCCTVAFADPMAQQVTAAMPRAVLRRGHEHTDGLSELFRIMTSELESDRPGSDTISARMADVAISMVIRDWAEHSADRPSWLRGDAPPGLVRALLAVHTQPDCSWTIAQLCDIAGMSRTRFVENFAALLGRSPGQYVIEVKMALATSFLREGRLSVGEIADRLGYSGQAAFSRAYQIHTGISPSRIRAEKSSLQ
jgi:AraC-like DNA-binding protein